MGTAQAWRYHQVEVSVPPLHIQHGKDAGMDHSICHFVFAQAWESHIGLSVSLLAGLAPLVLPMFLFFLALL